jgi:hypothetical protein
MKMEEMDKPHDTCGAGEKYRILMAKPEGRRLLGRW